jgi:hypothetical protein
MRTWARRSSAAVCAIALTFLGTSSAATPDSLTEGLAAATVDAAGLAGKLSPRLGPPRERRRRSSSSRSTRPWTRSTPSRPKGAGNARAGVTGAVNAVLGQLRSLDARTKVLFQTANAVSGVVVTADAAKLREIAQRTDVVSIRTVLPKTWVTTARTS